MKELSFLPMACAIVALITVSCAKTAPSPEPGPKPGPEIVYVPLANGAGAHHYDRRANQFRAN